MKAYSVDLRRRVVEAVEAGMSRPEAARVFQVSVATIKRYLKRRRETGSLAPGRSPGRPPEIGPDAYAALVAARPDDTLAQHAATWRAEQGAAVSLWAVDRALGRARITRKKSR